MTIHATTRDTPTHDAFDGDLDARIPPTTEHNTCFIDPRYKIVHEIHAGLFFLSRRDGSLNASSVHVFGLDASLALARVGLCPSEADDQHVQHLAMDHILFDSDALDLDETGRVGRLEPAELVHGRLAFVIQTL